MDIEKKVKETIEKYNLIEKNEKVVVALSGGKDSTSLLYILHKLGYNVSGLLIDLDLGEWSKKHNENMKKFCAELNIPLTIVDLKKEIGYGICYVKAIVKKHKNVSGCTVCGIIKKYILNKWAKNLDADKIATGHNLDDEAQTVLMNFLKGNLSLGAGSTPSSGIPSKKFVQRIKPLFFVPESEIKKYAEKNKFDILYDKCPCAIGTYRVETRKWMNNFSDKEKLKIVENFQKLIPELRKKQKPGMECSICGENSRNEVCNACKIFEVLK
jgi:uncharacterized protein (TIGR00269 family)